VHHLIIALAFDLINKETEAERYRKKYRETERHRERSSRRE